MGIYDGMAIQSGSVRYADIDFAVVGQIVDLYFHEIVSAGVATDAIEFGAPVNAEADGTITGLTDGTSVDSFKGIAVRELTREMNQRGYEATTEYEVGAVAAVLRKGHIYVQIASDALVGATIGGAVYTNGGEFYGSSNGAATDGLVAIPNATFESVAAAGSIAELRLA